MKRLLRIETVQEMMYSLGIADVRHPLIELIGMERATRAREYDGVRLSLGFYMVVYKRSYCGSVLYGQTRYDYADGTVLFFAPGQTFNVNGLAETKPEGRILMFDPELLRGSAIDCPLRQYPFFAYTMNEALHVSERERVLLFRNLDSINCELERSIDRHSHRLYASALAMLLDHCLRFYDRQFATRQPLATDIVARFERLLLDYFAEGNLINARYGAMQTIVNNAGIAGETKLLADNSTDNFREMIETNVMGLYYGMKYAIRHYLTVGGGRIVNLASIAGLNGIPYAVQYCATKHAVVGLTKGVAVGILLGCLFVFLILKRCCGRRTSARTENERLFTAFFILNVKNSEEKKYFSCFIWFIL